MKNRYEEPKLEINCLHWGDVLTGSQESTFQGDGWATDPFENK